MTLSVLYFIHKWTPTNGCEKPLNLDILESTHATSTEVNEVVFLQDGTILSHKFPKETGDIKRT